MKLKLVGTDGLVTRMLVVFALICIIFWGYLFSWAPKNLEFAVGKSQASFLQVPENTRVNVYDFNSAKWLTGVNIISQAKRTQAAAGRCLTGFGVASFLVFLALAGKVKKNNQIWLMMGIFIFGFVLAKVFYNNTFLPFDDQINNFERYFGLIKSLPFVAGLNLLARRLGVPDTRAPRLLARGVPTASLHRAPWYAPSLARARGSSYASGRSLGEPA